MKQKILFILHLPPPIHGAAMMGKYIRDSKLINTRFNCQFINLTTARGLKDIGKVGLKKIKDFINLLIRIRRKVVSFKPNFVYVTPNAKGGAFLKDFIVIEILKLSGCNIVLHYHNKGVKENMNNFIYDFLYKVFFKNVKVILLAQALYEDIKKYVSPDNVFLCPNGIPTEVLPYSVCEANAKTHFLFLSNLLIDKGILVLLDACKILYTRGIPFVCDIVGGETIDFDRYTFQEEIVRRGLSKNVFYHGRKYGDEKESYWCGAAVFVLPTLNECFPLVLLEAMQHSKACIATDEGGILDIIDEGTTGYIIPKDNAELLAEKMEYLIRNPDICREMGQSGFKKFTNLFTLKHFEENLANILLGLKE